MIIEHSRDCCYQQISLLAILDCETTLQRIPVLNIGLLDTLVKRKSDNNKHHYLKSVNDKSKF